MDPWSDDAKAGDAATIEHLARARQTTALPRTIIAPAKPRRPKPRDDLTTTIPTMRELAEFVGEVRTGLKISQAQLAARAGVSRQWLVALESGRPTVEAGKVLRTLEALGFEIKVTPYDPPPPWMMRAMAAAQEKRDAAAREARRRRNGRRARAKLSRLAENATGVGLDLG